MDPLKANLLTEETRNKRTWPTRALAGLLLVGVGFVGIVLRFYPSSDAPSSATSLGSDSRPYHWAPTSSATNPDTISDAAVAGVQPNVNQNIYVCRATAAGHYTYPGKAVHVNDNQCCFADQEKEWCEDKYDLLVGAGPFKWRPTSSATNPETISNAVVAGVQPNVNQNIYVCRATAAGHYTYPGKAVHVNDNQCCFADQEQEWCEDNYDILVIAYRWAPTSSATNPETVSNAVVAGVQPNVNQNIYVCRATAAGHYTYPGKAVHVNDNQCCFADQEKEWCEDNYDILVIE